MESNQEPKRIIEELKAAGEELKKIPPSKFAPKEENPSSIEIEKVGSPEVIPPFIKVGEAPKTGPVFAKPAAGEEEIDLLKKIGEYQKELSQEQSVLEKTHQEIRELEKKLAGRIELLKKLQTKSTVINKELKEFGEQIALAKKENRGLLEQIKNKLGD